MNDNVRKRVYGDIDKFRGQLFDLIQLWQDTHTRPEMIKDSQDQWNIIIESIEKELEWIFENVSKKDNKKGDNEKGSYFKLIGEMNNFIRFNKKINIKGDKQLMEMNKLKEQLDKHKIELAYYMGKAA